MKTQGIGTNTGNQSSTSYGSRNVAQKTRGANTFNKIICYSLAVLAMKRNRWIEKKDLSFHTITQTLWQSFWCWWTMKAYSKIAAIVHFRQPPTVESLHHKAAGCACTSSRVFDSDLKILRPYELQQAHLFWTHWIREEPCELYV